MTPISHKKLQKLFAQLMRIEEHRSLKAEKEVRKLYNVLLKELKQYVAVNYPRFVSDDPEDFTELATAAERARFLETVRDKLDGLSADVKKNITQTVEDVYKTAFEGMRDAVNKSVTDDALKKLFGGIRLTRPEVIKAATTNPVAKLTLSKTLEKHRREIIYDVQKTITNGIISGDRYSTMAKRLRNSVDFSYNKAILTIRTETHRVRETGHNDAAEDMDKKLIEAGSPYRWIKTWQNMQDSLVRGNPGGKYKHSPPDHWDMEGVTVLQDEDFTLTSRKRGLVKATCPGQSGTPDNDCNCRCFLVRDLVSDEEFFEKTGRHFPSAVNVKNMADNSVGFMVDNSGGSGIIKVDERFEIHPDKIKNML